MNSPIVLDRKTALADLKAEARRRLSNRWTRYADDPVAFAEEVLGLTIWSRQAEVLRASLKHTQVAVRAGRKVSKSTSIAILALHNALARGQPTLLTSSSYDQLKAIVWEEITKLATRARLPIDIPLDPRTSARTPTGGLISGRSVAKRENMQGYSGFDALYIADEASGLRRDIIEALEGNLAGGGRLVLFGNPTLTSGPFYDAFHGSRGTWHGIRISSRESPNVTGEARIPGLAMPEWIARTEEEKGADSPFVAIHIDGEFPGNGSNAVITLALVMTAHARWEATQAAGRLQLGVDVARSGDDETVVQPTRGLKALTPLTARGTDSHAVAQLVLTAVALHGHPNEIPLACVDVIGIGAGAYDVLRNDYGDRLDVRPVNVSESATSRPDEGGYRRLRDQLWFAVKDWLEEGGSIPDDELLRGDLIAPQYRFDERGRYVVSSKDELREATGRSPDRADALALSIYQPPSIELPPPVGWA